MPYVRGGYAYRPLATDLLGSPTPTTHKGLTVLTAALLYSPQVAAKRAKNYATADDLRRQLRDLGIEPDDMAALAPAAARRGGGGVRRGGRGGREEAAAGRGEDDMIDAMEEEWRAAEAHEKHVALAAQWLTARRNKVHPNTP